MEINIAKKIKISKDSKYVAGTIGLIISSISFLANDLFSQINFEIFYNNPNVHVYEAGIVSGLKEYFVGLSLMSLYVFIGVLISIVSAEMFIRVCELFNWKPRIYYIMQCNFLTAKMRKCQELENEDKKEIVINKI